jgi:hypothetical protein
LPESTEDLTVDMQLFLRNVAEQKKTDIRVPYVVNSILGTTGSRISYQLRDIYPVLDLQMPPGCWYIGNNNLVFGLTRPGIQCIYFLSYCFNPLFLIHGMSIVDLMFDISHWKKCYIIIALELRNDCIVYK